MGGTRARALPWVFVLAGLAGLTSLAWFAATPPSGAVPKRVDDAGASPATGSGRRAEPVHVEPAAERAVRFTVCLQPLGAHDEALLGPVARGIEQAYGFAVRTLAPTPLPESAWFPPRARHRAPALLEYLLFERLPAESGCHAIVGFTAVDISATRAPHADWGVLGLAYLGGRAAVVSSFRLAHPERRRVAERAVKVAIHELGHVVGVPHRDDGPACIMNDAVGAVATIDRADGPLCAPERAYAERFLGFALEDRGAWDWGGVLESSELETSELETSDRAERQSASQSQTPSPSPVGRKGRQPDRGD